MTFGDEQKTVRIAAGETTGTVELSTGDTVTITPGPAAVITHVAENDVDNAFSWTVENDAFYTKGEDTVGKLTVKPAELTIVTGSDSKEYDGKAYVEGEKITWKITGSQTEVGKSGNTYEHLADVCGDLRRR